MGFFSGVDGQSPVTAALKKASARTGAGFDYLFRTAMRESSMNPNAKARTSSAAGLFQFIESTWLETVKEAGPEHGLQKYASRISKNAKGRYVVPDPDARKDILALRFDPKVASVMAGALTERNGERLENRLGRDPSDPELYIAHFMGARGGGRLIEMAESAPDARADRLFPKEARANRPIFYEKDGRARTVGEVYAALGEKHGGGTSGGAVKTFASSDNNRQPILDLLGFFSPRKPDTAKAAGEGDLFRSIYAEAPPGEGQPRSLAGFWNAPDASPPAAVATALKAPEAKPAPTGGASTVADARSKGKRATPGDPILTNWLAAANRGAAGRPLDLAAAARLYAPVKQN